MNSRRGFLSAILLALFAPIGLRLGLVKRWHWRPIGGKVDTEDGKVVGLTQRFAYEGPKPLLPAKEPRILHGYKLIAREYNVKWRGEYRQDGKLVPKPGCVGIELVYHYKA